MQRRLLLPIAVLALFGTLLAAAALLPSSPPHVPLARSAAEADHVTFYQNGIADVRLHRNFTATTDATDLDLPLPPGVVFGSLAVEGPGVSVVSVRSALAQTSGLHAGDTVTVHADAESYHGVLQAIEGDRLAIRAERGLVYVAASKATAIGVEPSGATDASPPGSLAASVRVHAAPGAHEVTVSYLVQGAGWTPSLRLDAESGNLTFFATLTGLDDWGGVTLDLVAGAPHVVYQPQPTFMRDATAATPAMSAGLSYDQSFAPSTPLGELHRYHYEGKLDVARGESIRLVVAQGRVDVERRYLEVAAVTGYGFPSDEVEVPVVEKLRFRNALSEPLPPGLVRVYQDGAWIGEDALPATPKGAEANVTLGSAQDVVAKIVDGR